jgi:hypothetical protein
MRTAKRGLTTSLDLADWDASARDTHTSFGCANRTPRPHWNPDKPDPVTVTAHEDVQRGSQTGIGIGLGPGAGVSWRRYERPWSRKPVGCVLPDFPLDCRHRGCR